MGPGVSGKAKHLAGETPVFPGFGITDFLESRNVKRCPGFLIGEMSATESYPKVSLEVMKDATPYT
jgi:hypothetical protein